MTLAKFKFEIASDFKIGLFLLDVKTDLCSYSACQHLATRHENEEKKNRKTKTNQNFKFLTFKKNLGGVKNLTLLCFNETELSEAVKQQQENNKG